MAQPWLRPRRASVAHPCRCRQPRSVGFPSHGCTLGAHPSIEVEELKIQVGGFPRVALLLDTCRWLTGRALLGMSVLSRSF